MKCRDVRGARYGIHRANLATRSRTLNGTKVGICNVAMFLFATSVAAWNGNEHKSIGREAYHRACAKIRGTITAPVERLDLACTAIGGLASGNYDNSLFTYEELMGEWSALAADHTETPEQLMSIQLGDT